jgi:NSS family neurotransmitter:Na+ symporter
MVTYGSYLSREENLPQNAFIVTTLDTLVALLAGVAIFPALFAFGLEPAAGPGLVFVVVPTIFAEMGGLGTIFSALFFIALAVAALTSSVSLLETVTAYFIDQRGMSRKKAVYLMGAAMVVTNILASLSLGVMSGVTIFGAGFFDFFDILTDKIFLAIGGMLVSLFAGWVMKKDVLEKELTNGGEEKFGLFNFWFILVKYVNPIAIFFVAIAGIVSITQTSLMIFGLVLIAALAIFSKKLA